MEYRAHRGLADSSLERASQRSSKSLLELFVEIGAGEETQKREEVYLHGKPEREFEQDEINAQRRVNPRCDRG